MLRQEQYDDVTRLVFDSRRSRSMRFGVSAYLVRGVLVDTAFHEVHADLESWLEERRPDGVIVTHYHEDHAGNVNLIATCGLPVWMAEETLARVRAPASIGWYRRWCWGAQPALTGSVAPFSHPALEVIATPGHSSDHHVVWDAERETIFGADLFLGVKVRVTHPWPREDVRLQIASIRRVIALAPKRFFDAHRGVVRDPVSQLRAKAEWMEDKIGRIDTLITDGWDDQAIARKVLGGEALMSYVTRFDYSRRNFVGSVRATSSARR